MVYYVYFIKTLDTYPAKTYVGYTNNLNKRINSHNSSKGAKFTKGKLWRLIYFKKFASKNLAMKYEYLLKKNRKMRNLIKLENMNK